MRGVENFNMRGAAESFELDPGCTANIAGVSRSVSISETQATANFDYTLSTGSALLGGSFIGGEVQMGGRQNEHLRGSWPRYTGLGSRHLHYRRLRRQHNQRRRRYRAS